MSCYNFSCPITITEGGTFDQQFRWQSGDPLVPVDLTGYTSLMEIRAKLPDVEPLLRLPFSVEPWAADGATGIYLDADPSTGIYRMVINDDDTWGLCPAHKDVAGIYNLFLYAPNGEAVLRQFGAATILASAARKPTP